MSAQDAQQRAREKALEIQANRKRWGELCGMAGVRPGLSFEGSDRWVQDDATRRAIESEKARGSG